MSHALMHSGKRHWYDMPSRIVNRGFAGSATASSAMPSRLVVWARYPVLAGAILVLASQAAIFVRGDLQWRFFNSPEQGSVSGNFAMLPGATREDTLAMMRELQRATSRGWRAIRGRAWHQPAGLCDRRDRRQFRARSGRGRYQGKLAVGRHLDRVDRRRSAALFLFRVRRRRCRTRCATIRWSRPSVSAAGAAARAATRWMSSFTVPTARR